MYNKFTTHNPTGLLLILLLWTNILELVVVQIQQQ
jgi:cytochrome b